MWLMPDGEFFFALCEEGGRGPRRCVPCVECWECDPPPRCRPRPAPTEPEPLRSFGRLARSWTSFEAAQSESVHRGHSHHAQHYVAGGGSGEGGVPRLPRPPRQHWRVSPPDAARFTRLLLSGHRGGLLKWNPCDPGNPPSLPVPPTFIFTQTLLCLTFRNFTG